MSVADFTERTGLHEDKLRALAEAGAFAALQPDRRQALWEVQGLGRRERHLRKEPGPRPGAQLSLGLVETEIAPAFGSLDDLDHINWDQRTSRHSARGHPLGPLRAELTAQGLPDARTVAALPDGSRTRYAGLVICRQRPGTVKDVTFMTLEDETGFVNLVFWSRVFREHRILAKTLSFMGVSGRIQSEQGVVHLIVDEVWRPRLERGPALKRSRDFR